MRGYDDTYAHARSQRRETRGYPRYFELTPVDDKVDASFPPSRNRDTIVKKGGKRKNSSFVTRREIYLSRSFFPFTHRPRHGYRTRLKFPDYLLSPPPACTGGEALDIGTACGARLMMQMLRIDVGRRTDVREAWDVEGRHPLVVERRKTIEFVTDTGM